jgi:hypothetical protein
MRHPDPRDFPFTCRCFLSSLFFQESKCLAVYSGAVAVGVIATVLHLLLLCDGLLRYDLCEAL